MTGSHLLFLDEMKMSFKGKGGNRKASAVWGNRSNIRNQALLQKEGEGSTLGYLQNLICTDICCLPGGGSPGIWGMGKMPGQVKLEQNCKRDFVRALSLKHKSSVIRCKNMCFLNTLRDRGCKDRGID